MSAPRFLASNDFARIVRLAPLVSIDIIVKDPQGYTLLGLRVNEPAKGKYFVPGGVIRKNETIRDAFARILTRFSGELRIPAVMSETHPDPSVHNYAHEDAGPADPILAAKLERAAHLANENCDRATALAHKLSAQLRQAQSRINELELEADERAGRLWAEAETAIAKLQSEANARIERTNGKRMSASLGWRPRPTVVSVTCKMSSRWHSNLPSVRRRVSRPRKIVSRALRPKWMSASVARGLNLRIGSSASRLTSLRPSF